MLTHLLHGLTALGSWSAIAYLVVGALLGVVVGVIPGLSTAVVLSILLAFVYHVDLTGALCLFIGAKAGSYYSASVSAILLNTPAHPEAFPITFDGYPMARKGQAGRALGLSACSTCVGAVLGCIVFIAFVQVMDKLNGALHPPEYVALVTLAMLLVGTLGSDSIGKAIAAAGAGLVVASVGPSTITGVFRYTFGFVDLYSGLALVAVALGIFAIPQMVMVYGTGTATARQDMTGTEVADGVEVELGKGHGRELIAGVLETFKHRFVLLQGGIIGALTGIVPGIGGFTGNYLSYGIAKQLSRNKDAFGTGIPEGIIAPEGSSLAKEAGHMIPILALGIPGGVGGALFIAALTIKGVRTGYGFTDTYPTIPYEIAWILALSALIGTLTGVLIGPQIARVTKVPGPLLVPFIFAMCVTGTFLAQGTFYPVVEIFIFGLVGLALRRLKYPVGSFVLGLVLGPTFETNIYLTESIYKGRTSFLTERYLADAIFAVCVFVLILKAVEIRQTKRKLGAALQARLAKTREPLERKAILRQQELDKAPYPALALFTTGCLLGISTFVAVYGIQNYDVTTGLMPVIGAFAIAIPMACFLPRDAYRLILRWKMKSDPRMATESISDVRLAREGLSSWAAARDSDIGVVEPVLTSRYAAIDRSWGKDGQYRRELIAVTWLALVIGSCWLFGFAWGTTFFMVAYGLMSTARFFSSRLRWLTFVVASAGVTWAITHEMLTLTPTIFTPKIGL